MPFPLHLTRIIESARRKGIRGLAARLLEAWKKVEQLDDGRFKWVNDEGGKKQYRYQKSEPGTGRQSQKKAADAPAKPAAQPKAAKAKAPPKPTPAAVKQAALDFKAKGSAASAEEKAAVIDAIQSLKPGEIGQLFKDLGVTATARTKVERARKAVDALLAGEALAASPADERGEMGAKADDKAEQGAGGGEGVKGASASPLPATPKGIDFTTASPDDIDAHMKGLSFQEYPDALDRMPDDVRRAYLDRRIKKGRSDSARRAAKKGQATKARRAAELAELQSTPAGQRLLAAREAQERLGRGFESGRKVADIEWDRAGEELKNASLAYRLEKTLREPDAVDLRRDREAPELDLGPGPAPTLAVREPGTIPWTVTWLNGGRQVVSGASVTSVSTISALAPG